MSSVPMPVALTEASLAGWLDDLLECLDVHPSALRDTARAVRALLREKVREAVDIVSRVLEDHPQGGHDEARKGRGEAPRG